MTTTTPPSFAIGIWAFSAAHDESVRILDRKKILFKGSFRKGN
jgi:hypothetical protein